MFPLHCNQCYRLKELELTTLELSISQCGHVFCAQCAAKAPCSMCGRPFQALSNTAGGVGQVAALCEDPLRKYRNFQKTTRFQLTQQAYLFHYFVKELPEKRRKIQEQTSGYERLGQKLAAAKGKEQERIDKLREYLRYCELHPETMLEPRRHSSQATLTSRPKTPTITLSKDSSSNTRTMSSMCSKLQNSR